MRQTPLTNAIVDEGGERLGLVCFLLLELLGPFEPFGFLAFLLCNRFGFTCRAALEQAHYGS